MKNSIIYGLLLVGTLAGTACTKSELQTPNIPAKSATVAVALGMAPPTAAAITMGQTTKAATELTATEDTQVNNLWILQFEQSTGSKSSEPVYLTAAELTQVAETVTLDADLTLKTTAQVVYFIANAGADAGLAAVTTITELNAMGKTLTAEFQPTAAEGLPMLGIATYPDGITSSAPLSGTLERLVAKVKLKVKVDATFSGCTLSGVQLRNVPKVIAYAAAPSGTADYPALTTDSHFEVYASDDMTAAGTDGEYHTFTWYVPENLRLSGTTVTAEGDRILSNTSDAMATYIRIAGTNPSKNEVLYYNILLGDAATDVNDYKVLRNNIYTATVNILGDNTGDYRVEQKPMTATPANSFMVLPHATMCFDATIQGNGSGTAVVMDPQSVAIVWQEKDMNGKLVIAELIFDDNNDGLATVTVNGAGNALLAAYDASSNVLWSWHVWVSNYDVSGVTAQARTPNTPYPVSGGQVHAYGERFQTTNGTNAVIMDRNLGATKAYYTPPIAGDADAIKAYGLNYQWGRKDPFPNWDGVGTDGSGSFVPLYDASGATVTTTNAAGPTDIATAILNPTQFYSGSADWSSTQGDILWSNGVTKGLYDPCPAGWRIAPHGTWSDFTSTGGNFSSGEVYTGTLFQYWINGTAQTASGSPDFVYSGRNGRLYTEGTMVAWYPAAGYLRYDTGALASAGYNGYSWSSSVTSSNAHSLNFHQGYIYPSSSNLRAYGWQVRCLAEE